MKREALIEELQKMPEGMDVFITDGDLPPTLVKSVSVEPADFGQFILVSRY